MWESYCTFVMDVGLVESFVLGDVWFEKKKLLICMIFIWLHELMTTYRIWRSESPSNQTFLYFWRLAKKTKWKKKE